MIKLQKKGKEKHPDTNQDIFLSIFVFFPQIYNRVYHRNTMFIHFVALVRENCTYNNKLTDNVNSHSPKDIVRNKNLFIYYTGIPSFAITQAKQTIAIMVVRVMTTTTMMMGWCQ